MSLSNAELVALFQKVLENKIDLSQAVAILAKDKQKPQAKLLDEKIGSVINNFPNDYSEKDLFESTIQIVTLIISDKIKSHDFSQETLLTDLGMDSLMISSIANTLGSIFNVVVVPTVLYERASIIELVGHLLEQYKQEIVTVFLGKEARSSITKKDLVMQHNNLVKERNLDNGIDLLLDRAFSDEEHDVKHIKSYDYGSLIATINSNKLDVTFLGKGKPVVILGGLGSTYSHFEPLCVRLSRSNTVFYIELPGFGKSSLLGDDENNLEYMCYLLKSCLDLIGVNEPICIIGFSLGGVVAQYFSLLFSEKVRKICIINSSPYYTKMENFFLELLGSVDNSLLHALRPAACPRDPEIVNFEQSFCANIDPTGSRGQAAGRRGMNCQRALKKDNKGDAKYALKNIKNLDDHLLAYYDHFFNKSTGLKRKKIKTHGLWITGENDPVSKFAIENGFQEIIPNLKKEVIVQGGHFTPWTHTDKINELLDEFLVS